MNKVSTKVELNFDVENSQKLTEEQRELIFLKLERKINTDNVLQVISQATRSQLKNKEDAIKKFRALIEKVFYVKKKRRPTKVPKSAIKKRLNNKKRHSELKKNRSKDLDF